MIESLLSTIISILVAICMNMGVDISNVNCPCESCGESYPVTEMVVCDNCGAHICKVCNDSYIYTVGNADYCFYCDYEAPAGQLPEDYIWPYDD